MLDLLQAVFKYKQKRSPDKLGLYPQAVHTNAIPERRYLWSTRLLVILASIGICFNMMLVCIIYLMLPQREATPRLFKQDTDTSSFRFVSQQEIKIPPKELLAEGFIRDYITKYHSILPDKNTMKLNLMPGSKFYWFSSKDLYNELIVGGIDNFMLNKPSIKTRKVNIEWVRPISRGLWTARFATLDYYDHTSLPIINLWMAYIRTVFGLVDYDNYSLRENNPYGFFIYNYSLSYLGSPSNTQEYIQKISASKVNKRE